MIRALQNIHKSGAVLLCLLLAGCFSLPSNKAGNIYQLRPMMAAQSAKNTVAGVVLGVSLPRVPAGYDRDRIALALDSGRRLDYYQGVRWPAALPDTLHGVITQSLRGVMPQATVDGEEILGTRATHKLDVEVINFTPVYNNIEQPPVIHVTLRLVMTRLKDNKILSDVTLTAQQAVAENKMAAVTAGLEAGLHEVLANALPRLSF